MQLNYRHLDPKQIYKLMSQTIVPRPIAWIVTEKEGIVNVAPFSYFTGLSSKPPSVIVSIGHKSDGTPKDTLANLRATRRCTICMVDPKDLTKMHFSSKSLKASESEAEIFDIPMQRRLVDYPPMVATSPVAFFCDYLQEIELPGSQTVPIVLTIDAQYLDDRIVVDADRLTIDYTPLARVGRSYALLGDRLDAPEIP